MPTVEARLATDRAGRYLVQLCRHLGQMSRTNHRPLGGHGDGRTPPAVLRADWTETHGTVRFADGRWTLEAAADTLTLRVDADDEAALERLKAGIAARIEKIGRRDGLRVQWQSGPGPSAGSDTPPPAEQAAETGEPVGRGPLSRRPRGTTTGLLAGGAVIVAVHLGVGGAALAGAAWTGWAANAVLALILLKILVMGGHLALGRVAVRRGAAVRHHGGRRADRGTPSR